MLINFAPLLSPLIRFPPFVKKQCALTGAAAWTATRPDAHGGCAAVDSVCCGPTDAEWTICAVAPCLGVESGKISDFIVGLCLLTG